MEDFEIIGTLRTYVNETLVGMGALKGANCRIQSITKSGSVNTVVFVWTDTEGEDHTNPMLVSDGEAGADGVSPTITVKTSTDDTYILTITDKNGSYDTPNLKGSGGVSNLTDVDLTNLANGCALVYNSTSTKWEAVALGTAAYKDSTSSVTEDSTDLVESGAVFTGLAAKANTADLGTAAAKDSTNAVTEDDTDLVESGAVYTAIDNSAGNVSEAQYSAISSLFS